METRGAPRIEINIKVISQVEAGNGQNFSLSENNIFEANAIDISTLGMGIACKYFLPTGLRLEMEIAGEAFGLDSPMKAKGEVRWCNYNKQHQYRCGIKFIDISEEYKKKIIELIAAYERRKEPRLKLSQ